MVDRVTALKGLLFDAKRSLRMATIAGAEAWRITAIRWEVDRLERRLAEALQG